MARVAVKISSKYQIAVPSAIRKELRLEAGDYLLAQVRDGIIVLVPRQRDVVEQLRGLHRDVWTDEEIDAYVNEEREAWDDTRNS